MSTSTSSWTCRKHVQSVVFIETARNPRGFQAALAKANAKRIPIIALKVGRTEKAAQLAVSHSGAMAGDDATYDALFDRYGVQRVRDMDEFATALIMFSELHPVGPADWCPCMTPVASGN